MVIALGGLAAQAQDPFYLNLLREGRLSYDRGDYSVAVQGLRLACFGFLDQPDLLAEGLVRLAAAQAQARDEAGFAESFRRVLEVEERFGAYGRLDVPDDIREVFERSLLTQIPRESLAGTPFQFLVRQDIERQLASLPPQQQVRELERRLAEEPESPRWHLALAGLHLDDKRFEAAAEHAQQDLALEADNAEALCIRGACRAHYKDCRGAIEDLSRCPAAQSEARYALALGRCQFEQGEWQAARQSLLALSPELQQSPAVAKLERRIRRVESSRGRRPEALPPDSGADAEQDDGVAQGPRDHLVEARQILAQARSTEELNHARTLAKPVADAHPEFQEAQHLMAEIAYRASRWTEAVSYFQRGGEPADDQPHLQFYMAVSLYESGDQTNAAKVLRRCLPSLQKSGYVESYMEKIFGSSS